MDDGHIKSKTTIPAHTETKGAIRRENESRILIAAETIFSEEGFKGATIGMIADRAGVAKPNIHYYFGSKTNLYRRVIESICDEWMATTKAFTKDSDPRPVLISYVRAKMMLARQRPQASRLWAIEMARGAPFIQAYLSQTVKPWLESCACTVRHWSEEGKIASVDAQALFYMIWATTQHYADFEAQIIAINNGEKLSDEQFEYSTRAVISIVMRAVGLAG